MNILLRFLNQFVTSCRVCQGQRLRYFDSLSTQVLPRWYYTSGQMRPCPWVLSFMKTQSKNSEICRRNRIEAIAEIVVWLKLWDSFLLRNIFICIILLHAIDGAIHKLLSLFQMLPGWTRVFCFQVSAVSAVYVILLSVFLPLTGCQFLFSHIAQFWTALVLLAKMIYQLGLVDNSRWLSNCTVGISARAPPRLHIFIFTKLINMIASPKLLPFSSKNWGMDAKLHCNQIWSFALAHWNESWTYVL